MRLAAAAYPMDVLDGWSAFERKVAAWVAEADADLLVFPEYGLMELATLAGRAAAADLEASLHAVAARTAQATEIFAAAAAARGCHILMPSGPVFCGARPVNRATLVGPDGVLGFQDKQVMTRFEREHWDVVPGEGLRLFEVAGVRLGVLICYDAEFPDLGAALIEAGVEVLLVPSCTDARAGYTRVRIGAMARALEGQCVVVHAATVGACDWSPAVDENIGAAAIYGPPDRGFPEQGILAEGALNAPGWVRAALDLEALDLVRREGQVLNRRHGAEARARARVL